MHACVRQSTRGEEIRKIEGGEPGREDRPKHMQRQTGGCIWQAAFKGWDAVVSVFKERADIEYEDFFAAQEKADQPIEGFDPSMAKRVVVNVDDFSIWQVSVCLSVCLAD